MFSLAPSISCLVHHKLLAVRDPLLNSGFRPYPTTALIFGASNGDNGYIMFYRSSALAKEAARRWVAEQQKQIGIPNLRVPGVRQTVANVVIDWLAGPRTPSSRRLVT